MVVLIAMLLTVVLAAADAPPAIGFESSPFQVADIQAVRQLAREYSLPVWFLRPNAVVPIGSSESVHWHIEVYLQPRVSTPRLRRGQVATFYKVEAAHPAEAPAWKRSPAQGDYAEVTPIGLEFPHGLSLPSSLTSLFDASESITDDDLVSIFDLVRMPLTEADLDRLEAASVREQCGHDPAAGRIVLQVSQSHDEGVKVYFKGGCCYQLARQGAKWAIVAVGIFVS